MSGVGQIYLNKRSRITCSGLKLLLPWLHKPHLLLHSSHTDLFTVLGLSCFNIKHMKQKRREKKIQNRKNIQVHPDNYRLCGFPLGTAQDEAGHYQHALKELWSWNGPKLVDETLWPSDKFFA